MQVYLALVILLAGSASARQRRHYVFEQRPAPVAREDAEDSAADETRVQIFPDLDWMSALSSPGNRETDEWSKENWRCSAATRLAEDLCADADTMVPLH
jgi:hypothetical protein